MIEVKDRPEEVDAYLGAHPNRVEALELGLAGVRKAYESGAAKTFEWTSALARGPEQGEYL